MKISLAPTDALIVVDVQNDFLPGGALAVPEGNKIIPVLNHYINFFSKCRLPIFATRDWHPSDHCSFLNQGGPWPSHCIKNSNGAEFAPTLELPAHTRIISKATTQAKEAYSAFDDTPLDTRLHSLEVRRLFIGGLATEYCVFNTVKDAVRYQYMTFLLEDAICGINQESGDARRALDEMKQLGAIPLHYEELLA